jgi:SAM-dependent methyltransferase
MDRMDYVTPNFPVDAFAGTASYYVRYRIPYPEPLLEDLIDRSRITGGARLLDLACGPGRVALALVDSFREVWAIDIEPEMIDAARKEAMKRRATNIKWLVGRAESLDAPDASFDLITVGEAFHRLDQRLVAAQSLQWLKPGGHLAILGCFSILSGTERWQRIVVDIVRRWTARASPPNEDSAPRNPGSGPEHDQCVLKDQGFEEVGSHPFVETHDWTIDSILGYLYSTSVCSRNVLGGNADRFENDLRSALGNHDPGGVYRENLRWGFTMGRKPLGPQQEGERGSPPR